MAYAVRRCSEPWSTDWPLGVPVVRGRVGPITQNMSSVTAAGYTAHYLAAADGLHSGIRRQLGLTSPDAPTASRHPTLRRGSPAALLRVAMDRPRRGLLVVARRGVRDPSGRRPRRRRHPHLGTRNLRLPPRRLPGTQTASPRRPARERGHGRRPLRQRCAPGWPGECCWWATPPGTSTR